jgi:hypothetical protein
MPAVQIGGIWAEQEYPTFPAGNVGTLLYAGRTSRSSPGLATGLNYASRELLTALQPSLHPRASPFRSALAALDAPK